MKILKLEIRNGSEVAKVTTYVGHNGSYFEKRSSHLIRLPGFPYLFYKRAESLPEGVSEKLESVSALQYDKGVSSANLGGYATRSFFLKLLASRYSISSDFVPYSGSELLSPITKGEVGYLLTYAAGVGEVPSLGMYQPSPNIKLSAISVEGEDGTKFVEFRLGRYSGSFNFDDYLEDVRTSSRPVPLPLWYGFCKFFNPSVDKLFGQLSRESVLGLEVFNG